MSYWLVADGDNHEWRRFLADKAIYITGRNEMRDLTHYRSTEGIRLALKRRYPAEYKKLKDHFRRKARLLSYFAQIAVGDEVFVRHGINKLWGYGLALRPIHLNDSKSKVAYFFDPERNFRHAVTIDWKTIVEIPVSVPRHSFEDSSQFAQDFIARVEDASQVDALKRALRLGSHALVRDIKRAAVVEGQILLKEIQFRVRSQRLIAQKKAGSDYCCEICNFKFERVYGERGRGFIVAHHIEPLGTRRRPSMTRPEDIALICANCHAMLHTNPPISLNKLRIQVERNR